MNARVLRCWYGVVLAGGLMLGLASTATAVEQQPFQISKFTMEPTERTVIRVTGVDGNHEFINEPYKTPFTQAGGHPWALTTRIAFPTREYRAASGGNPQIVPVADPKDIVTYLPPGLLGDPLAVPRCPLTVATSGEDKCPADTQVGVYSIRHGGGATYVAPIVNVTPEAGQSAEFALENTEHLVTPLLTGHLVRTARGYGFAVASNGIPSATISSVETYLLGGSGRFEPRPDAGIDLRQRQRTRVGARLCRRKQK